MTAFPNFCAAHPTEQPHDRDIQTNYNGSAPTRSDCRISSPIIRLLNEQHHESIIMSSPRWQPGESGNPAGRKPGSRNRLNEEVISSFLRDWRVHGDHALAEVRRTQPAVYCKLAVLLVPREQKVEHVNAVSGLSDEQLAAMIADLEERIARRAAGGDAKLIEGAVEELPKRRPSRLMVEADTAIGPRERKPRKRKVPPTLGA
jgi:uncharacterized protein DUF5681